MPTTCTCPTNDDTAPVEEHDEECPIYEGDDGQEDATASGGELVVPGLAPGLSIVPAREENLGLASMAATLAQSNLVPKALQAKPADVFLVLLTARDLGISLTTALRECHVIDGKVALSPKVKMAKIRTMKLGKIFQHQPPRTVWVGDEERRILCPCGSDDGQNNGERATWHAERADEPGILTTSTFTMEEARQVPAKENGQRITLAEKSTYRAWPARMLSWRALGHLEDDVFPEVGTGLYDIDQVGGMMDGDGQPIDVALADPLPGTGRKAIQAPQIPLAPEEVRRGIQDRVNAIRDNHPAAKAELAAWWNDREVGKVGDLTEPQSRVVLARLAHVEAKFGLSAPGAPQDVGDGPVAVTPTEPPTASESAREPVEEGIPSSPPGGDVAGWLIQRASAMNSASIETAFKVQGMAKPAGSIGDQRRAWAIDQMTRLARGTCWAMGGGAVDVATLEFIQDGGS